MICLYTRVCSMVFLHLAICFCGFHRVDNADRFVCSVTRSKGKRFCTFKRIEQHSMSCTISTHKAGSVGSLSTKHSIEPPMPTTERVLAPPKPINVQQATSVSLDQI